MNSVSCIEIGNYRHALDVNLSIQKVPKILQQKKNTYINGFPDLSQRVSESDIVKRTNFDRY